jgi:hypothetical protein
MLKSGLAESVSAMNTRLYPALSVAALCFALMLVSEPAHAFRCGNKLVKKDMHEAQVRAACGAPTTARIIGSTVRDVNIPIQRGHSGGWSQTYLPGYNFLQEVIITEYVYNFGPRKFMRRLLFEGGMLVSIESVGYGYREDD